ncbi:hypothetical protein EBU99_10750 [bacterium]|nr:hypothetical protein [bacterium]
MNEFAVWINEFTGKIGFEFSSFDWTKKIPTDAYDIQCSFVRNGKSYLGRGTESKKDLAIIKSTAEMLERFFLDQIDEADSSNGVAVHTDVKLAEISALCELLERDSFFCHFLTKTPFTEIEISSFPHSSLLQDTMSLLKLHGAEIRIGQMRTDSRFCSVVCAIYGLSAKTPFGMTLGTSVKLTVEEAIESALTEAARSAIAYLLNPELLTTEKLSLDKRSFSRPEDHLRLGLNTDYAVQFREIFFRSDFGQIELSGSEIDFERISISSFKPELFDGSLCMSPPVFLARASSDSLINLFFGEFVADETKLNRLGDFLGRPISSHEINSTIHPFA